MSRAHVTALYKKLQHIAEKAFPSRLTLLEKVHISNEQDAAFCPIGTPILLHGYQSTKRPGEFVGEPNRYIGLPLDDGIEE